MNTFFTALRPRFEPGEFDLIDQTVRMNVNPRILLSLPKLTRYHVALKLAAGRNKASVDVEPSVLSSNVKFAEELKRRGATVPMKISKTTNAPTFALAKSDPEFLALIHHPDEEIRNLVAARMGMKSVIAHTRTMKFMEYAETIGRLPVKIMVCGANTTRDSGAGGANLQNVPGGSPLRYAMEAPTHCRLIVSDAKQIEARIMCELMGQKDKVRQFANNEDVYAITASGLHGRLITKETDPRARQVGKVADLQLQYVAGAYSFWAMCAIAGLDITLEEAAEIVKKWRQQNPYIYNGCRSLHRWMLSIMTETRTTDWVHPRGWFAIGRDMKRNAAYIEYNNNLRIWYPEPRYDEDKFGKAGWGFSVRKGLTRSSQFFQRMGPTIVANNTVQGLARAITLGHAAELHRYRDKFPVVLRVHDELVFMTREQNVPRAMGIITRTMRKEPAWADGLVLDVDIASGQNYGECK